MKLKSFQKKLILLKDYSFHKVKNIKKLNLPINFKNTGID